MFGRDADADSGATEIQYATNRVPDEVVAAEMANKHLRSRGGRGDPNVARIGDAVLTIRESVAVAIALDIIDDCERRHSKKLGELTLLQLNEGIDLRCEGRACTPAQVGAEMCRLQNVAIYGGRVPRR